MAKYFELFIPGRPVPWARTSTHQGRRITPLKQRDHKTTIAENAALLVAGFTPMYPAGEPLFMDLFFCYPMPKRPKTSHPTGRPDIDNLVKMVADALNGLIYADDSQVVELRAIKTYSPREGTDITVGPV